MSYEIVLKVEEVAGALVRVMSCLRKQGLSILGQSFEALPGGGRKLILEVDGPVLGVDQLQNSLEVLRGVAGLLLGDEDTAPPEPEAAAAPPKQSDTRYKNKDSEAGDADMRDRMLIFSLLSRYPNLSGRLVEISSSIPEPERPQRMLEIGQGFGQHLSKNLKINGEISELRSAIERMIVPGLSPLVEISQNSEGLRVSGYTKNLKHMTQKPECCHFLSGTIQGLLDSQSTLPAYRVEHTQCRHSGATSCDFRLTPA